MRVIVSCLLSAALLSSPPALATTYLIKPDGTGDAPTIQAGIDSALSGVDTVLVAAGTYTGAGNRDVNFNGKGVVLVSQCGPDSTIIDCMGSASEAHRALRFDHSETPSSIVDGFTLRGGYARWGGAVYCGGSSPTIRNCIFIENTAWEDGGGLSCQDGSFPVVLQCTFCHNFAAGLAGGVLVKSSSRPTLMHCIVAFTPDAAAVDCGLGTGAILSCCDLYGNAGGDWVGCIAGLYGQDGNISDDPMFCAWADGDLHLREGSPCADAPGCGLIGALGVACGPPPPPRVWRIHPDGSGDLPTIQDAINAAASGDTVELSNGTFTGDGNWNVDFLGKPVVVRSQGGDPQTCTIDCGGSVNPHRGFLFRTGEGAGSVLKGVTITEGYATSGGGIYCSSASPTLTDLVLNDSDAAGDGGGIWCSSSSPTLTGVVLSGNQASGSGGGIFCRSGSYLTLCDVIFSGNSGYSGGAICCIGSSVSLTSVTLSDNSCASWGGGLRYELSRNHGATLANVIFRGNSAAARGGAICFNGSLFPQAPLFLQHVTFEGNSSGHFGGAICCTDLCCPQLSSVTFYGNSAPDGAAMYCYNRSNPTIENTIIAFSPEGASISCLGSSPTLSCCDLYANAGGDWVGCIASQYGSRGNVSEDPIFCNPTRGNFHLYPESPCAPFSPPNEECDLIGAWPVVSPTTYLIEPDGTGDFPTIQDAIDAANDVDVILLADGVFSGEGNHSLDFGGKALTLRSAQGEPEACIIDCDSSGCALTFRSGESPRAKVEGITICNGMASWGGAVYCLNSSPSFDNMIFSGNRGNNGGGAIWCEGSAISLTSVILAGNSAPYGGALYCDASTPTLSNVTMYGNHGMFGGSVALDNTAATIENSIIAGGRLGVAVYCFQTWTLTSFACCDIYGNAGGDWVGCISGQFGMYGNISEDPQFCGPEGGDFRLEETSPCAPFSAPNPECDLIGARPVGCAPTGIAADGQGLPPRELGLQTTPNPFRRSTRITYVVPGTSERVSVRVRIYDALGRRVRSVVDALHQPGVHPVVWDGANDDGMEVSPGVYFCVLSARGERRVNRIVLLR